MTPDTIHKEKIGDRAGFAIWLVNGEHVRKSLNENFVGYDQHACLSCIPTNEFWIDAETNPEERHFFIDHLITEQRALAKGLPRKDAAELADKLEKRERAKLLHLRDTSSKKDISEIISKIHRTHLPEYRGKIAIWLVNGTEVRNYFSPEYFEGGHDLVYNFIPSLEIWIEEILSYQEQKFIILHELHERFLMSEGKDYHHAHPGATQIEDRYR